jgi:uncharacterized protein (DUF983 family)
MASERQSGAATLLDHLDGDTCPWCEEGELERESYKESPALVCTACNTPVVRDI